MSKKQKEVKKIKAWMLYVHGLPRLRVYFTRQDAQFAAIELTSEQYHCPTCDCEPLKKSEVKVMPCFILPSILGDTNTPQGK